MTTALVLIGGSAGALDALFAIVSALPAAFTTPLAIVVHVSAHHPSRLAGLLAGITSRKVCEPDDKTPIEASCIYVAPPNYHLFVEADGTFALSVDAPVSYSRPSIDVLFESAVDALGGAALVGIVLSGANDDGARGLARIAAAGGRAIVQAPASAAHATMPAAALGAVPAALSVPIARLAAAIAEHSLEATT